jgi:predicted  nucleic acid-binding Zn-ribbon protein
VEFAQEELKNSILGLLKLQEIDGALFQLREQQTKPSESYAQAEKEFLQAQKELKAVEKVFRDIERERRSLELRHITLQEDVKKAEIKRREVRNTKEDFSAGKELENFQKKLIDLKKLLEEKQTKAAERSQELEEQNKRLAEIQTQFESVKAERDTQISKSSHEVASLMKDRDAHISKVNDFIFSMYERVQKLRRGSGVAIVKDGICHGCFVEIPPQTRSKLRKLNELMTCSSCSRILFPEEALTDELRTKFETPPTQELPTQQAGG